jgi:hypothetical protein
MNKKAVDSLVSALSSLSSKCQSLELRVSVAESLIQEHAPKLYKEYEREINTPQVRGFSLLPTQALQELRKDMLRGPDEEAPSSG